MAWRISTGGSVFQLDAVDLGTLAVRGLVRLAVIFVLMRSRLVRVSSSVIGR